MAKTKIVSELKTVYTFKYNKGNVPLSFNLSSQDDIRDFLELLELAIVDVKKIINK